MGMGTGGRQVQVQNIVEGFTCREILENGETIFIRRQGTASARQATLPLMVIDILFEILIILPLNKRFKSAT